LCLNIIKLSTEEIIYPSSDGQPMADSTIQYQQRELEAQRAEQEAQRADRLAAKLRELNIDPDSI
jgi:hypothetical protein